MLPPTYDGLSVSTFWEKHWAILEKALGKVQEDSLNADQSTLFACS